METKRRSFWIYTDWHLR